MNDITCCENESNMVETGGVDHWELQVIAAKYNVSERTIQRWVSSGQFPYPIRLGRKKLWLPEQVAEFMRRRGQEAQETQAARNMLHYEAPVRRQRRKRHVE